MEGALDTLLESMLAETGFFISLGQALGGLGSILYVFYRIWGHLARNEPIDIFPLLRPVAVAMCLVCYTALADGVVSLNKALDDSTRSLVSSKKIQVEALFRQRAQLQQRLAEEWASRMNTSYSRLVLLGWLLSAGSDSIVPCSHLTALSWSNSRCRALKTVPCPPLPPASGMIWSYSEERK